MTFPANGGSRQDLADVLARVDRTFSVAETAGLRTMLDALIATID